MVIMIIMIMIMIIIIMNIMKVLYEQCCSWIINIMNS